MLKLNDDEVKKDINNIDFSRIIKKLIVSGWLKEDAIKTCEQYRNYLFLRKKYSELPLPPSLDIDNFWHEHILDTQNYFKDCKIIFGYFLHHSSLEFDTNYRGKNIIEIFENTKKLYLKEFGEEIIPTKSRYPEYVYKLMYKFKIS